MPITGSCLCGQAHYQCEEEGGGGHCHCIDCRKTSATGHASHMIVPEAAFKFSGEIKFFEKAADSGNMVQRGFCPECGSALYSTNSGMPGVIFVRASSLDDLNVFKPQMVVYTDRAAEWDVMDMSLPRFAKMPAPNEMPETLNNA